ncbi:MAG TPA: MFS transporter [Rhizomicrobium sp.]|nr:MFS transporter [Rhizomicrobium sp.]
MDSDISSPMPWKHVAAVSVGNALEFYDFVTYSFFSLYIGRAFFPGHNESTKLLLSLATFGVGFLTRPIGAIVIGRWADRAGRKPAMIFSFAAMGAGIVGLSLTPPYAQIGIAAPVLVIAFRLVQGFALGGNVGPATAYMVEAAPPLRRGFYASMQAASQDIAVLLAGIIATALAAILTAQEMQDWGWRVTMLAGAAIVPFGLALRRRLPETLHAAGDAVRAPGIAPARSSSAIGPWLPLVACGLLIFAATTVAAYTADYMTTYALTTLHMEARIAFGVIIVVGVSSIAADVASGLLSDRFGRRPVMLVPGLIMLVSIVPAFHLIGTERTTFAFYAAIGWLAFLFNVAGGPIIVVLAETLPQSVRAGAISTVYAFAIAIFGGSTQVTIKWLLDVTGNPLAPAWYWTFAAAIGFAAMLFVRESAPIRLGGARQEPGTGFGAQPARRLYSVADSAEQEASTR